MLFCVKKAYDSVSRVMLCGRDFQYYLIPLCVQETVDGNAIRRPCAQVSSISVRFWCRSADNPAASAVQALQRGHNNKEKATGIATHKISHHGGWVASGNAFNVSSTSVLPGLTMCVNVFAVSDSVDSTTCHPLDPLSAVEIHSVAELCRAYSEEHGYSIRFNTIGLRVSPPERWS